MKKKCRKPLGRVQKWINKGQKDGKIKSLNWEKKSKKKNGWKWGKTEKWKEKKPINEKGFIGMIDLACLGLGLRNALVLGQLPTPAPVATPLLLIIFFHFRFLHGITDEMFEEYRKRLLAVTVDDLVRVSSTYLNLPSGRCVLGPKNPEITQEGKYTWKIMEA